MKADGRVVVIGSGPAGAMAARSLVRRGVRVTMLESGAANPKGLLLRAAGRNLYRRAAPPASPDETFVTTGDPQTSWATNLAPGGLSNQWTGAVPRFDPADFSEGARLHEKYRWPVSYDELAPFYAEAERVLHVTASRDAVPALPAGCAHHRRELPRDWRPIARTARSRGQGLTVLPLADGPPWMVTRRSTAFNSYTNVVQSLLGQPNFELLRGAHALRLEWSGAQRRIESVVYHDRKRAVEERLPVAGVVVACGPLRSTKLLFDSACSDFPDGIGNGEGLLGKYLHDHPKEWWTVDIDGPLSPLVPAGYLTRRPYESSAPLMASSWTIGTVGVVDKVLSLTPWKTRTLGVQVFGTMRPTEDRFVRPHPSATDEFGLPQLEISIRFDADELSNMNASRQHFLELMADAGRSCRLGPVAPQLMPGRAVHYGGTARMHRSPRYGVLDEWNRPFGVSNLIVTDASCFTTNSEKNPTLTAMALSARAASRLADDLKRA